MMLYISVKFHENILKGFLLIKRQRNYHCKISKENDFKNMHAKVTFLVSACCLMMFYISLKFHENLLNGFLFIEQTRNYSCQNSKGNNANIYKQ